MGRHAILGPSASSRWSNCPGSVRLCRDIPTHVESVYAREGTQFHTLAEIGASHRFLGMSDTEYEAALVDWMMETDEEWRDDQLNYLEEWLVFLEFTLAEEPGGRLLLEQRVDTGVPGCWGTADVVILSDDHVHVIDIKYGAGLKVSAVDNPQLRLYGVGALHTLAKKPMFIRDVTTTIWQPRMNNISSATIPRDELLQWRDDLIPIAQLALGEDAPFGPSEDACRFCPAAGECAARTRYMLDADFGNPDLLTGEEMADAFRRTPELKRWVADIEDTALKRAYEDAGSVPGFKVVRSGGRRSITDPEKAVSVLLDAGYDPSDVYTRKPATLGQLEKLTGGSDNLQQVLGGLLVKSEGRLSLAPDSDPRQPADAVHSAQDDFAEITDKGEA